MLKDYKRKILMLKNALTFIINIIILCVIYVVWDFFIDDMQEVKLFQGVFNTVFMLYAYFRLARLIENIRKTTDEGEYELKGLYNVYICFLLVMICCTYSLEEIKSICVGYNFKEFCVIEDISIYAILSCAYRGIQIIQTSIGVVLVKDVIFQINGWNIHKTMVEYWGDLLKSQKIYILHEDQHKKVPRLWLIRGDACADIVDYSNKAMIHHSEKEYIQLTDNQSKEILRRRKIKDNEECCYEGDSACIFTPWKMEHFYAISLIMIDLDYYKEEEIEKLVQENKEKILILPSDVKSCERKHVKKIAYYKEKVEKMIVKGIE